MYSIGMRGSSGEMGWNGPYEIDTGEGSAGTGCCKGQLFFGAQAVVMLLLLRIQ